MADRPSLDGAALAQEGYRLVRSASDKYRRTAGRVDRLRKQLRLAEAEHQQADRDLRAAILAVQPTLPIEVDTCCPLFDALAEKPIHAPSCREAQTEVPAS